MENMSSLVIHVDLSQCFAFLILRMIGGQFTSPLFTNSTRDSCFYLLRWFICFSSNIKYFRYFLFYNYSDRSKPIFGNTMKNVGYKLHSQPRVSHTKRETKRESERAFTMIRIQIHEVMKKLPCCQAKLFSFVANTVPLVTIYVN